MIFILVKEYKRPNRREKRASDKNVIVFLQVNENIGPLSIFKSQLDSLRGNRLFCDVDLLENDGGEKVVVYGNRIQKKFEIAPEGEDRGDDGFGYLPSHSQRILPFLNTRTLSFLYALFFILCLFLPFNSYCICY